VSCTLLNDVHMHRFNTETRHQWDGVLQQDGDLHGQQLAYALGIVVVIKAAFLHAKHKLNAE
jgi:hypothetical protein